MITMTILLCLNAVPHEACDEQAAVWVMHPAVRYTTPSECAVASMQMLPIIEDADDSTHPVIRCR